VPTKFKHVPLFTKEENLENVLKIHVLNEAGIQVSIFFIIYKNN